MDSKAGNEGDALTAKIIGTAIEVHTILGPGMLESIYEEALSIELQMRGLSVERQVALDVNYKGQIIKGQRLDLLVDKEVIIEIKSQSKLPEVATAQVISYLRVARLKRGLILNFGLDRMMDGVKRISN